jgi:ADP-ribose pyrophosphatase YjhB (NUDIX family)
VRHLAARASPLEQRAFSSRRLACDSVLAAVPLGVRRGAYRLAYRALSLTSLVWPPRGRGAKALLLCGEELLLVRHTYGPSHWELPGGRVRRGEDPLAALRRELREELGVNFEAAREIAVLSGPGRRRLQRTHVFEVDVPTRATRIDPAEIGQAQWWHQATPPTRSGWMVFEALAQQRRVHGHDR